MSQKLAYDPLNIVICGIGGQGNIVASELLGSVIVDMGYICAIGETYGASQRGGSVMSHVRVSDHKALSVLIPMGRAHIIVGFEPLETLRMVRDYGNKDTTVVYDPRPAYPLGVLSGEAVYPEIEDIDKEIREICGKVYVVEASQIAIDAGNSKAANIALMGALTGVPESPVTIDDFMVAINQRFKGAVLELNKKVIVEGNQAVTSQI